MLKKVLAAATLAGAVAMIAGPASADPRFCYDVNVHVNETALVQAGCLPE